MGDILKSSLRLATLGNAASAAGIATITDNHGNSTSGFKLSCAGKSQITLSQAEWDDLHRAIAPHSFLAFSLDGKIPMRGGLESPLAAMCRHQPAEKLIR